MAYTQQTWINLPNQTTPISAERLNHMEQGIYDNSIGIEGCALITEAGYVIELVLDNETYKLSAKLKDKDGNLITTSNIIDLPIESLIVSITYDSDTKELVITYEGGGTLRIPISDLISGLEVTSNKVTSISSSSTDTQYPSGKAVYDFVMDEVGDIETLLTALDVGGGVS